MARASFANTCASVLSADPVRPVESDYSNTTRHDNEGVSGDAKWWSLNEARVLDIRYRHPFLQMGGSDPVPFPP